MTTLINLVIISALVLNIILIVIFVKMASNVRKIKEHLIQDELIKINDRIMKAKLELKLGNKPEALNKLLEADFLMTNFVKNKKPSQESMGIVEYRDFIYTNREIKKQIEELQI